MKIKDIFSIGKDELWKKFEESNLSLLNPLEMDIEDFLLTPKLKEDFYTFYNNNKAEKTLSIKSFCENIYLTYLDSFKKDHSFNSKKHSWISSFNGFITFISIVILIQNNDSKKTARKATSLLIILEKIKTLKSIAMYDTSISKENSAISVSDKNQIIQEYFSGLAKKRKRPVRGMPVVQKLSDQYIEKKPKASAKEVWLFICDILCLGYFKNPIIDKRPTTEGSYEYIEDENMLILEHYNGNDRYLKFSSFFRYWKKSKKQISALSR